MNATDVTVPITKLPLPSNQTESHDDDNGIETIKSYMTVAVVPLVIILLSITVALLSWAFSDRCFISIFMVLLSIINLFFAFVHVFAWNSPIMMTVPFFLASAAMGLLLQIVVGLARCVTSCLKYDEAYLSFSTFFTQYLRNETCGLAINHTILAVAALTTISTLPVVYFWVQFFIEQPAHAGAHSRFISVLLFLSIFSVQASCKCRAKNSEIIFL